MIEKRAARIQRGGWGENSHGSGNYQTIKQEQSLHLSLLTDVVFSSLTCIILEQILREISYFLPDEGVQVLVGKELLM